MPGLDERDLVDYVGSRPVRAEFHSDGRVFVSDDKGNYLPEYMKSHKECLELLKRDGIHWSDICTFGVPNKEALAADGWNPVDRKGWEERAKPFPLEPLGMVVIVKKISSDLSAGGVYIPTNDGQFAMIVGEVVAVGLGMYSSNGTILRPMVKVGDVVTAPLQAAKQITFEVQRQLKDRGLSEDEIKDLFVIPDQMLAARFV